MQKEQANCSICLGEISEGDKITALPCDKRHYFHSNCIKRWAREKHSKCPLCNVRFTYSQLKKLLADKVKKMAQEEANISLASRSRNDESLQSTTMGLNTTDTLRNFALGLNTSSNLMTATETVVREETDGVQGIIEEVPEVQERHS